ncbi:hypothetical protein GCM10009678_72790 [Actinomadura kijaniata]|uniref:Uncharacterized protein n=1 Tax=Actinomadura namibiensis TaxID=182080 RepID=A0A7W3M063_ACTNM|nr:hypothetical protein [Actinomadura namibiensis]MBA8957531.1 hypothetical protein [Actinomadura namibiensis]
MTSRKSALLTLLVAVFASVLALGAPANAAPAGAPADTPGIALSDPDLDETGLFDDNEDDEDNNAKDREDEQD